MGYEDTRYDYAARNLFRGGMPLSQGVFLGLYILWLGQHTSNYIHAPVTVAILKDNGLQFEDQKKINSIDQKVRLFTAQFESQFLACSDSGLQGEEFGKALTEFGATIVQFRREFIEEWVGRAIDTGLDRTLESWNSVPTGTMIVTVPIQGEAEKSLLEMQERLAANLRSTAAHTQDIDRIVGNLYILRDWLLEASTSVPGQPGEIDTEKAQKRHDALTEINQAAMMGPYKVTPEIHGWLVRTKDFMLTSREELSRPRLHKATIAVRIATIDQALAVIEDHPIQPSRYIELRSPYHRVRVDFAWISNILIPAISENVRSGPHKRRCRREGFSVHASIANYQNEARSGLSAMRPWQELAPDLGPTALGSREPFGRSSPIRRDRTAAGPKTRPSCSSHNRRPSPGESIQGRAPFESSVHCT